LQAPDFNPGTWLVQKPVTKFGFKCNLYRYILAVNKIDAVDDAAVKDMVPPHVAGSFAAVGRYKLIELC
jgi:hypothetical protein